MVVHDFDIHRATFSPNKTNSELIVHPDAVLTRTITA